MKDKLKSSVIVKKLERRCFIVTRDKNILSKICFYLDNIGTRAKCNIALPLRQNGNSSMQNHGRIRVRRNSETSRSVGVSRIDRTQSYARK